MIQVVTPPWFYGKDLIIDIVSVFVLSLIAFFSIRYYRINKKNRNYIYLAISFLLMAVSFLAKILTNFTVYYHIYEIRDFGIYTLTHYSIKASTILFDAAYLFYRLLMIAGLYILYSIYQKSQPKSNIYLIAFFILVSAYFSQSQYYIFHLTALMLLALITIQLYNNFRKNMQHNAKLLAISFAIIGISQIFFMSAGFSSLLYVIAETIQLLGYSILLITFIKVLRNAKKKE